MLADNEIKTLGDVEHYARRNSNYSDRLAHVETSADSHSWNTYRNVVFSVQGVERNVSASTLELFQGYVL